jgi:hypothetical protein
MNEDHMGVKEHVYRVNEPVGTVVPDDREYESVEAADLDRSLCNAITAAEEADNEYLAELLRNELGSHFYSTR